MKSLTEVKDGNIGVITWMIGRNGSFLKETFSMQEEDTVKMVSNCGPGGVIVRYGDKILAMTSELAYSVKVNLI